MSTHADCDVWHDEANSTSVYTPTAAQLEAIAILTGQTGPRVRMTRQQWRTVLRLCAWREGKA